MPPAIVQPPARRRAAGSGFHAPRLLLAAPLLAALLAPTASANGTADPAPENRRLTPPASQLNRSEAPAPWICGHLSAGGAFEYEQGEFGYGGAVIFPPATAANFIDFLEAWNTGLVLQADYLSLGDGGRILSGDLILRRYFRERRGEGTVAQPFVGIGLGASSAQPGPQATGPGLKYWSLVLEGGQEWRSAKGYLLFAKGQLRILNQDGWDYSSWAVLAGFGLPFPW